MFNGSRGKRNLSPAHAAEGISQTLAHSAGEAASRVSGAANQVSGRVANQAGHVSGRVAKEAGQVSGRVASQAGQVSGRVADSAGQVTGQVAKEAGRLRGRAGRRSRRTGDVMLKAQLAKTSRELRHESSELTDAVHALNGVIKANRKAAARGRTRLVGGLAIGAALMYHLDPVHGRQRRLDSARRLGKLTNGKNGTTDPAQPVA